MRAGMDAMGPETADFMKQTPLYEAYANVAPNVEDWPILVEQLSEALKADYDWSREVPGLSMPVMLGVLVGAFTGSRLLVAATPAVLRTLLGVVIVALAIEMIVHGVAAWI